MVKLTSTSKLKCMKEFYAITFVVICDPNANRVDSSDFVIKDDFCHPTIYVKHSSGCPVKIQASGLALWSSNHDPVQVIRQLQTDKPQSLMLQAMFCVIVGIALALYGSRLSTILVEAFLGYSAFITSLAYFYEESRLSSGYAIIISLLIGTATSYAAYKWISKSFVASLGIAIGVTVGVFVIALFDISNDFIVYPVLIFGGICGAASFFRADEFFVHSTAFVGSIVAV
jgi:hypothetical protein